MAVTTIKVEDSIIENFRKIEGKNDTERLLALINGYSLSESRVVLLSDQLERIIIAQRDLKERMDRVEEHFNRTY